MHSLDNLHGTMCAAVGENFKKLLVLGSHARYRILVMATDAQLKMNDRAQELMRKPGSWTDREIKELYTLTDGFAVGGTVIRELTQIRSNIELIDAIRGFDKASADLINTTNGLTKRILRLTVLATVFAALSLLLSFMALFK